MVMRTGMTPLATAVHARASGQEKAADGPGLPLAWGLDARSPAIVRRRYRANFICRSRARARTIAAKRARFARWAAEGGWLEGRGRLLMIVRLPQRRNTMSPTRPVIWPMAPLRITFAIKLNADEPRA